MTAGGGVYKDGRGCSTLDLTTGLLSGAAGCSVFETATGSPQGGGHAKRVKGQVSDDVSLY